MEYMETEIVIALVVIVLIAIFFVFLLYMVLQIRNKKRAIGVFIGEKDRTIDRITPGEPGYVRFKGKYWQARSDTTIEQDTKVVIVDKDESVLIVKPKER